MGNSHDLLDRCHDLYGDEEVANWVYDHVKKVGTEDRIRSGELVLPHPIDARKGMEREKGVQEVKDESAAKDAQIADLSNRLAALEQAQQPKGGG